MQVVSQFRPEYWIVKCLGYLAGLALAGLCIWFVIQFEYDDIWFWAACITLVSGVFYGIYSLLNEIKQLEINDAGINIKYFISKKTKFVSFHEIKDFKTTHITQQQGGGRTEGYQQLQIELLSGGSIIFSEYQFKNYVELKGHIYQGKQNQ